MPKKKESKKETNLEYKIETIFEILSQHKIDIEYLSKKIDDLSTDVNKGLSHFARFVSTSRIP